MALEYQELGETDVAGFVEKLREFRGTLAPSEQRLLDGLLLVVGKAPEGDVQGYGLDGPVLKRAALAAVVALGLVAGGLGSTMVGTAQASELVQGTDGQPAAAAQADVQGGAAPQSTNLNSSRSNIYRTTGPQPPSGPERSTNLNSSKSN